jgi:hypothetical protein
LKIRRSKINCKTGTNKQAINTKLKQKQQKTNKHKKQTKQAKQNKQRSAKHYTQN